MSNPIIGTNVLIYVTDPNEGNIPFACGLTARLSTNLSLITTTNFASNYFEEYRPNRLSWSVSISGIAVLGNYDFTKVMRDQKALKLIYIQFSVQTDTNSYQVYSGYAYAETSVLTANYNEISNNEVTLRGTGAYTVSSVNPPPSNSSEMRLEFTVSSTSTTLTLSTLAGYSLLEIFRGGSAIDNIYTDSTTPTGNAVRFVSATGQIITATDNPFLAGETGYCIYK